MFMQGVEPAADSVFGMAARFDGLTRSRHVQISSGQSTHHTLNDRW